MKKFLFSVASLCLIGVACNKEDLSLESPSDNASFEAQVQNPIIQYYSQFGEVQVAPSDYEPLHPDVDYLEIYLLTQEVDSGSNTPAFAEIYIFEDDDVTLHYGLNFDKKKEEGVTNCGAKYIYCPPGGNECRHSVSGGGDIVLVFKQDVGM
ncbi:MAG: hypothetical protein JJU02_04700 [Cryomorphaceae bacterium]|nr:hypothetical protein [Cryomorphaceae bacterium]